MKQSDLSEYECTDSEYPWQDKDVLVELYAKKGYSQNEIAERLGCGQRTVSKWLNRYEIDTSYYHGKNLRSAPRYHLDSNGYETWQYSYQGERWTARVHQLLAIAEGVDPYDIFGGDLEVHHKNEIPFDNRPDNLETMTEGEHMSLHQNGADRATPWQDKETLREAYESKSMARLGEEWGCSHATIHNWLKKFEIPRRSSGERTV